MSKVTKKEDYRVVVEPDLRHHRYCSWDDNYKQKDIETICQALEGEIRRHCDDVISVRTEWDSNNYCEYCGAQWTEDSPTFNGGCCSKDMESRNGWLAIYDPDSKEWCFTPEDYYDEHDCIPDNESLFELPKLSESFVGACEYSSTYVGENAEAELIELGFLIDEPRW